MKVLITICARGGSKGIPGKNIKHLNGKPLIVYSIESARKLQKVINADIALSTDSEEIKQVAREHGLDSDYTRPDTLATDGAGKIAVIEHLTESEEARRAETYDYVIDLDVTAPLRTQEDLLEALKMLKAKPEALNIFSVNEANRNPYFNMVEEDPEGFVKLVKQSDNILSRQRAPKVYDMNASFYVFRRHFFNNGNNISITDKSLAYVMPHICFDLDHPHDFTIMEIMFREKLFDFEI